MEMMQGDEFTKAAKLYGEIRGFIEKPQVKVENNTQINNVADSVDVSEIKNAAQAERIYKQMIGECDA